MDFLGGPDEILSDYHPGYFSERCRAGGAVARISGSVCILGNAVFAGCSQVPENHGLTPNPVPPHSPGREK